MLLIKNVKIVDGSGYKAPYPADVLVNGDKISAIGNFPNKKADIIIEGLGGYLVPGFIDINTDADHYLSLFSNPSQNNFALQGVTTIIGGQCGSSLAPLLYGTLESIRKWTNTNQINVNWHSFNEFISNIKKLPLGVNFGSLIGHSTIRRALIGEDFRDLTDNELKIFQEIIHESLAAGAFGLSTGLSYSHSRQTPYYELKLLANMVLKHNALYSTHLRDEKDDLYASVTETLKLYKETGVNTHITHLRPLLGYEKNFEAALDLIDKSTSKMNFNFDIYPFNTSIIPLYTLLPDWVKKGNLETMLSHVRDKSHQSRILKDLPKFKDGDLIVAYAPQNKFLIGKTIPKNQLLEFMILTNLRALVFYKNINYSLVTKAIFSDKALVASNSGGFGERATSTFPKFLDLASQNKKISIENAIHKITDQAAQKLGLKNRGLVKEGYFADLALVLNNQIQYVIINGAVAVYKGVFKNSASGRVLTHAS